MRKELFNTTARNHRFIKITCSIFCITFLLIFLNTGYCQNSAYTSGKLAVVIIGDGTTPLTTAAAPVFVKEFNLTGASQTGVVRTTLPTIAVGGQGSVNRALTANGSGTNSGFINLSENRQFLTITGYNCDVGTADVSNTSTYNPIPFGNTINQRVIGWINGDGIVGTTTNLNLNYSEESIRSAVTKDGSYYWVSGTGINGITCVPANNQGAMNTLSDNNTRGIGIFNNQLYVSSGITGLRLAKVGTGLPTSGTQTLTNLNGFLTSTGDPESFVFIDVNGNGFPDVLYVASLNTAPAGLLKYTSSDNGTSWTARGMLAGNVFGVTGNYNSCTGNVDLYITANTTNAKPNKLYHFRDYSVTVGSPANITSNGSALSSAGSLLATAANNTAFGGVAFTPKTIFTAPVVKTDSRNTCSGLDVNITLSGSDVGVSYRLYKGPTPIGLAVAGTGNYYPIGISFGTHPLDGSTYTIIGTNPFTGCTTEMQAGSVIDGTTRFSLPDSFCLSDPPYDFPLFPSDQGVISGPGTSSSFLPGFKRFSPAIAGVGTHTITFDFGEGSPHCLCTPCFVSKQVTVTNCDINLNLKLFLQGYYIGSNIMQPVLNNQLIPSSSLSQADTIIIELHHPTTYALVNAKKAVLQINGTASATFTNSPQGNYYIAIRHRNSIYTWSANPVACTASTPLYDFTTAANMAMGDNQVQVQTGKWAFFTGDLNQDEFIDGNDFPAFDTDSFNGVNSVYVATDMNGDGFVDGNDFPVFDVNSFNGVSAVHP